MEGEAVKACSRQFTLVSMLPKVATVTEGDTVKLIGRGAAVEGQDVCIDINAGLMDRLAGKTVSIEDLAILTLIQERDDHLTELADISRLYLSAEMKLVTWVKAFRGLAKRNNAALQRIFDRSGVGNIELEEARAEYRRLNKLWKRGDMPDED